MNKTAPLVSLRTLRAGAFGAHANRRRCGMLP